MWCSGRLFHLACRSLGSIPNGWFIFFVCSLFFCTAVYHEWTVVFCGAYNLIWLKRIMVTDGWGSDMVVLLPGAQLLTNLSRMSEPLLQICCAFTGYCFQQESAIYVSHCLVKCLCVLTLWHPIHKVLLYCICFMPMGDWVLNVIIKIFFLFILTFQSASRNGWQTKTCLRQNCRQD